MAGSDGDGAPTLRLDERVAIVTGGAGGIGAGIVRTFAELGARPVIADKDADAGARLQETLRREGYEVLCVPTDVREPAACAELVAHTRAEAGRVDVLVNNVGGTRHADFLELGADGWRRHLDLNLTGLFAPTDAALRAMIEGGRGGAIVNVASIEAVRAAPGYAVYAACKAAMLSFTKSLALEVAAHGIRVNAIAPDVVDTPIVRDALARDPGGHAETQRRIPLGRLGTPRDCAAACAFLASEAAAYLTGETLHVDGGTLAAAGWRRGSGGGWTLGT